MSRKLYPWDSERNDTVSMMKEVVASRVTIQHRDVQRNLIGENA